MGDSLLPPATRTQAVARGEAATVVLGHGFDPDHLSDADSRFALVGYFWRVFVLLRVFFGRSARIRSALGEADVLLLVWSALN